MRKIQIFNDSYSACYHLAEDLKALNNKESNIAISGGSSPLLLFNIMKDNFVASDFSNLNFFWVDERFVESESEESNYGNFSRILIDNKIINRNKVFPMYKNGTANQIIKKIKEEIKLKVPYKNDIPFFDLIILGLGDDGHTASLFPDNLIALDSNEIIIKTEHPKSKQKRLTLTKNVINNSSKAIMLCLGKNKAKIVKDILINNNKALPASYIQNKYEYIWYLDEESASLLN